jgi:beta-lactamase regulating signal transducer with metallopeptidase domain
METFIYIIKSIAILSIFYIIYRIVLQKDTFFSANRHYLLSGIIAALVIPFIEYTKTIYREIPVLNTPIIEDASFATTAVTSIQPQQEAISVDWWQIALIIYGVGFAIMMIRLLIQLISLHRLITPYPKTYKDGYAYVQITDKAITPFSFFKTICYNPNLHSPKELDMILAHEKIHVRQRHTLDILLTQCILTIQWFNPLAWLYKKSLEQNLEFIADNGAIQEVPSSQEYQRTLVKVSSTILQPALTKNFYHSIIKKRIVMLNNQTSSRRNLWKLGLVLPALAIFMYSFNVKEVIKYKESSVDTESAFAKAETNSEKKEEFYINDKTKASQQDAIESHFTTHYPEKRIKFDNRVFHENGYIRQFSFQTKFSSEKKFFTRFEVKPPINKDWSGYQITNTDEASIQVKELGNDGVTFKITKENLVFNDNTVKLNPVLAINDETSSSNNLIATTANITDKTQQLQQSLQNNINATSENTQSLTSRIQGATNNIIKEANNLSSASESQVLPEAIKKEKAAFRTQRSSDKTISLSKFKVRITKNTTDQELKKIRKDLKEKHGVEMDYAVSRNSKNEIISLKIEYKTANNNSSRYSVNGDDPITDVYIYENEDGSTGIGHTGSQKEMRERMEERQELMQERMEKMQVVREERQEALKERRQEIEERREEIRSLENNEGKEAQERLEKMEERMLEQKEHMAERKEEMKIRQKEMKEEMHERKEEMKMRQKEMKKHLSQMRSQQSGDWDHSNSESITITKNTTDAQIQSISSELKSQGITFSLTKVKRNSRGEITGYKMKFNNNNGTESVSQRKTNSDSPIEPLHIVYNDGNIKVHN